MKKSSKIISKLYKIHIKFGTHCATQWAAVKIWMLSINEPIKQIIGLATEISNSKIFGIRNKKNAYLHKIVFHYSKEQQPMAIHSIENHVRQQYVPDLDFHS